MRRIYLDHAATTPVRPEVLEAMLPYFGDEFGNPSSIHFLGQETRVAVEEAREQVARLIGAEASEIVFTSSGTEADNFALKGIAFANRNRGKHIITSSIEHHAVLNPCHFLEEQGFDVTYLGVDRDGLVDPEAVAKAVRPDTILVSIMHANNEIGTLQPVEQISTITREHGICFHTDAVQTVGRIPVDVEAIGADLLSMAAHKLYGPKGVGALFIRRGTKIHPFMHGGGQEKGRRASTENVPGIVGFGKAAAMARSEMDTEVPRLTSMRDRLISGLLGKMDRVYLNGHPQLRLPNNVNLSIDFVEGESLAVSLDLEGIAASTGSACTSTDMHASHVLTAIGVSGILARGSLRFSLGHANDDADVDYVLDALPGIVNRLRAISPLARSDRARNE